MTLLQVIEAVVRLALGKRGIVWVAEVHPLDPVTCVFASAPDGFKCLAFWLNGQTLVTSPTHYYTSPLLPDNLRQTVNLFSPDRLDLASPHGQDPEKWIRARLRKAGHKTPRTRPEGGGHSYPEVN